ncbi:glycoside hydrolase superfamily [Rhypophila decipiens]|uniref:alpha-galactosidase n=1 Tax=Rhypophila decipiens TaxID=261697 RepID=A0AAN6XZ33_9PEZI|nr:glycoside hydrolase superfamily [Rhypophila decipiens]
MAVSSGDEGTAGGAKIVDVSRRTALTLVGILVTLTIGVALGLGLGFGLNHNGSDSQSPNPPHPTASATWQPAVNTSWQIILSQELSINHTNPSITPDVEVFDIDMFVHLNTTIIHDLHKLDKKVICYFSAGSYEPFRRDSDKFQDSDMGNVLDGWEDEKWLNITSPHVRGIMSDRIDLAALLGCDAIDPDNMDGYLNDNGLDITTDEAVDYLKFLADKAKAKNMAIGLKNAPDLIPDVLDIVQFSVNEQCAAQDNCASFSAFIEAGKPVFHIEYPSGAGRNIAASASKRSCTAKDMAGFSTVMKELKLDAWVEYCDGTRAYTNVVD